MTAWKSPNSTQNKTDNGTKSAFIKIAKGIDVMIMRIFVILLVYIFLYIAIATQIESVSNYINSLKIPKTNIFPLMELNNLIGYLTSKINQSAFFISPNFGNEIIFLTPVLLGMIFGNYKNLEPPKSVGKIVAYWMFLSFIYGLVYFILTKPNVMSIIFVVSALTMTSYLTAFTSQPKGNYLSNSLQQGLKIYTPEFVNNKVNTGFMSITFILMLFLLFYYEYQLSSVLLADIFILLITSCLFVLGFLALMFTYAHQKGGSHRSLQIIEDDTNTTYLLVGISVTTAFFGLILFGSLDITFTFKGELDKNTVAMTVFIIALSGTLQAIEATIYIFTEIASSLTFHKPSSSKLNILFDESQKKDNESIMSRSKTGMSDLRSYLIDEGHQVFSYKHLDHRAMDRTPPDVLVIQQLTLEIRNKQAHRLIKLIENGMSLILFIDKADVMVKIELLHLIGFDDSSFIPFHNSSGKASLLKTVLGEKQSDFSLDLQNPVATKISSFFNTLSYIRIASSDDKTEDIYSFVSYRTIGKGLLVIVGDIRAWNNTNLNKSDAIYCLSTMLDLIENKSIGESTSGQKPKKPKYKI